MIFPVLVTVVPASAIIALTDFPLTLIFPEFVIVPAGGVGVPVPLFANIPVELSEFVIVISAAVVTVFGDELYNAILSFPPLIFISFFALTFVVPKVTVPLFIYANILFFASVEFKAYELTVKVFVVAVLVSLKYNALLLFPVILTFIIDSLEVASNVFPNPSSLLSALLLLN